MVLAQLAFIERRYTPDMVTLDKQDQYAGYIVKVAGEYAVISICGSYGFKDDMPSVGDVLERSVRALFWALVKA